jgi:WD40 repeat protein
MGAEKAGGDGVVSRMRAGIASAVRAGGRLAEKRPSALAAFLAASAFAPFLAPGAGELAVLLNQVGGIGGGYLAAVLTSAAERDKPEDLAEEIKAKLEADGEESAGLRRELSAVLRQIGAVEVALAADPQIADGLAGLGEQLTEFGWMLGDTAERLSDLVGQSARHGRDLHAARAELGALTALLQRVVQAQDDGRERTPARTSQSPYPGMRPFESRDAVRFFGREELTAHLIARLAEQLTAGAPLVVLGSSGAGKSSLVRAGLIPALRQGRLFPVAGSSKWRRILVDRLGADPLATLAEAMGGGPVADDDPAVVAAGLGPADRFVLVVDQFEEIFTQCLDLKTRVRFVRVLLALAARGLVVLSVRADFYQDCAALPDLGGLLAENQLVVGPLAEADLRRAITLPALKAGCTVEPGLPELMITNLGLRPGVAGYEPGALPLLAYALRATWDRRTGNTLTVAGYREAGGIHGAVAAEAERIFADLPAGGSEVARRIMLRLVNVGREGQLTRRRVAAADLLVGITLGETVLARFTQARLVTADEDGVEITHEAFLTAWPRLTAWITEDRAGLRLHRQLGEDARAWSQEDRDPGSLYRGAKLSAAIAWQAANDAELTSLERSFLDASAAAEQAVRHRERRQNRRLRVLAGGLAVVLAAALAAGGVAVQQQRRAVRQSNLDNSAQFAAQSDSALTVNLLTSDLDALAGWQADHTFAARSSLLSRQADPYLGLIPEPVRDDVTALAINPDGTMLAVGESPGFTEEAQLESSTQLWDLSTRSLLATIPDLDGPVHSLAFSPDGRTLAVNIFTGFSNLQFWNVSGRYPHLLADPFPGADALADAISYSPSGHLIAIGVPLPQPGTSPELQSTPNEIEVWNTLSHQLVSWRARVTGDLTSLAFSPDGRLLVSGGDGGQVQLWDPHSGAQRAVLAQGLGPVSSVLFSPDGQHVAVAGGSRVLLCDLITCKTPAGTARYAFTTVISQPGIAFGPQGRFLYATTGPSGGLGSYDVAGKAKISPDYELPAPVYDLAASGDVMVGSGPGGLYVFDLDQRTFVYPNLDGGGLTAVAAAPGSRQVATGAGDGNVQLWRPGDPAAFRQLTGEGSQVDAVAFSQDAQQVAAIYQNCDAKVWQPRTGHLLAKLPQPGGPVQSVVRTASAQVAFVPGQHSLITACSYEKSFGVPITKVVQLNSIVIRDARWHAHPLSLPWLKDDPQSVSIAVSPDGRLLAVSTGTGPVLLLSTSGYQVVKQISTGQGNGPLILAFSPDSRLLATANSADATNRVKLWSTATGKLAGRLGSGTSEVRYVAFSPSGRTVAVTSQDATVRLWNMTTHRLDASLAEFPGVLGQQASPTAVDRLAFLSGSRLVTVTNNSTATVWNLNPSNEKRYLCRILGPSTVEAWWQHQQPSPGPEPCPANSGPDTGTAALGSDGSG